MTQYGSGDTVCLCQVSTSKQCDIQTLVTEAAHAGVIREVPRISRVFVLEDERKGLRLCTEGINMTVCVTEGANVTVCFTEGANVMMCVLQRAST